MPGPHKKSTAEPRRSSRGSSRSKGSTSSSGHTPEEYEDLLLQEQDQEEDVIQDEIDPDDDRNDFSHENTTQRQDVGIQGGDEETVEELLQKAHEAVRESRYAKTRDELLKKGLEILYQQGDEISLHSNEIEALSLTESELKTLLRRYTQEPQKKSLKRSYETHKSQ